MAEEPHPEMPDVTRITNEEILTTVSASYVSPMPVKSKGSNKAKESSSRISKKSSTPTKLIDSTTSKCTNYRKPANSNL